MATSPSSALRTSSIDRLGGADFDVLVLGGGINGAVAAAALSAHGAKVALVDRGDFAGTTSQESSNLVWGGIKYLEAAQFSLVRDLCKARNRLAAAFPSSVREIRFYTGHPRVFRRSRWELVAGSWLYWAMGGFWARGPRSLSLADMAREEPILALESLDGGLEYSDAYMMDGDARFVWGFVRSALDHGCAAANYVEALGSDRGDGLWQTRVRDRVEGREVTVRSRLVVNACGPYADEVNARDGVPTAHRHFLSKGIHLIVDRLGKNERVLTFFADDGRLFFAIPMGPRTCIGTTDTPVDSPQVTVTQEDRRFVLDNINKRLRLPRPLVDSDVIAERCGVRPLAVRREGQSVGGDWMQLSRRHVLEADAGRGRLTIFGGKLTDCLNVGEEICDAVRRMGIRLSPPERPWYGEPPAPTREAFLRAARGLGLDERDPFPADPASARLWRRHGMAATRMLEAIRSDPRAGEPIVRGAGVLRCELDDAAQNEMVVRLEDFLRRRTHIAQVVRRDDLSRDPGIAECAQALFGEQARAQAAAYFGLSPAASEPATSTAPAAGA